VKSKTELRNYFPRPCQQHESIRDGGTAQPGFYIYPTQPDKTCLVSLNNGTLFFICLKLRYSLLKPRCLS